MKRLMMTTMAGVILFAVAMAVKAQTIQINKDNRTIAITTSDEATAPADTAQVSIGFTAYGNDSDGTYADGSRISNGILAAVRASGVKDAQIASRSQNLQPLGEEDKIRFGKGIRFQLNQSWQVTVPAAEAAKLLNVAINAGANNSGDIGWSLADDNSLQAEAAEKALTHARAIADRMASGLHAKLGVLVYASNQTPPRGPFAGAMLNTESASVAARMLKTAPLAVVPDKVSRSATIYAVFAIE